MTEMVQVVRERLKIDSNITLRFYEVISIIALILQEIKPDMIEELTSNKTYQQSELGDGDIIIFERELSEKE